MAMADLVMPGIPDNRQSWFHLPHQHSPTGHQRSNSYHMVHQQQQLQLQEQQQQQHYEHKQRQQLALQLQQQQQQHQQQQISPQPPRVSPPYTNTSDISPLSTSNSASPLSPKNYHGRQVRPLYMPAVLRPNEFCAAPSTTSPSADGFDDHERAVRPSGSFSSLSGILSLSLSSLSRRSTSDSGKIVDWNWDLSNYPPVNGEPTRRHWKADSESDVCDDPTCKKYFNYFVRRHHCRRCGNIFCDSHSMQLVPLDESANFNPRGDYVRACNHCVHEFKAWRTRTDSPTSGLDGPGQTAQHNPHQSPFAGSKTMPATPISASPTTPGKTQPEVALSVPSDWNWSTF